MLCPIVEASWEWSNSCNDAFFELKKQLMTSPSLVFPDFKLDFVLDTDASGEGIGAVLSQSRGWQGTSSSLREEGAIQN